MRNLTSVQSTNDVVLDCDFELTASDQSTTFVFGIEQVEAMPNIEWEIDFAGGFGKTSKYTITVIDSLDVIKSNLSKYINGETNLKVTVNSDVFYPHVGRVRTLKRDSRLPGRIRFDVYDDFLDDKKTFPPASLVDSYDTINPNVIESDWGQPYYYGANVRPYYHVPVDCSIKTMIGPVNVSSENHTNSILFIDDRKLSNDPSLAYGNVFTTDKIWGNSETVTASYNFYINDTLNSFFTTDYTNINLNRFATISNVDSNAFIFRYVNRATTDVIANPANTDMSIFGFRQFDINGNYISNLKTAALQVKTFDYIISSSYSTTQPSSLESVSGLRSLLTNGGFVNFIVISQTGSSGQAISQVVADGNQQARDFVQKDTGNIFTEFITESAGANAFGEVTCVVSFSLGLTMDPDDYNDYSIYSLPVNTSDISISENPLGILDDVFDQTSTLYNQDQSSVSQTSLDDFKFQCYFGEREQGTEIFQEFGQITNTYMWAGDSGLVNYRTYENSANANIDKSLTVSDVEKFDIIENPIGSTRFRSRRANEVEIRYNYDFQKQRFLNTQSNNKNNNAFCESADAAGINDKIVERTRYIIDSATASKYLDNLTRKVTQSEEFVNLTLPPKFLELELSDIINVQNPMIVGSESLYQIIQIEQDYNNGKTKLTARELIL